MKRVLIIGKNSYIGNHIESGLLGSVDKDYDVVKITARKDGWKETDFSVFDTVVHVAALVHHPETTDEELYRRVNTELPVAVAKKAKEEKVRQFIFFSTMAIYGAEKSLKGTIITKDTKPSPNSLYGKSKYLAEQELLKLTDDDFKIIIIRPPNVYGKDCPGKYISGFVSVVRKLPAIPAAYEDIRQSMLYIDNLTELVKQLIDHEAEGIYMPQDEHPVSAVELMEGIAAGLKIRRRRSKILGFLMRILRWIPVVRKAYGGVMYGQRLNSENVTYQVISFREAIAKAVE